MLALGIGGWWGKLRNVGALHSCIGSMILANDSFGLHFRFASGFLLHRNQAWPEAYMPVWPTLRRSLNCEELECSSMYRATRLLQLSRSRGTRSNVSGSGGPSTWKYLQNFLVFWPSLLNNAPQPLRTDWDRLRRCGCRLEPYDECCSFRPILTNQPSKQTALSSCPLLPHGRSLMSYDFASHHFGTC